MTPLYPDLSVMLTKDSSYPLTRRGRTGPMAPDRPGSPSPGILRLPSGTPGTPAPGWGRPEASFIVLALTAGCEPPLGVPHHPECLEIFGCGRASGAPVGCSAPPRTSGALRARRGPGSLRRMLRAALNIWDPSGAEGPPGRDVLNL